MPETGPPQLTEQQLKRARIAKLLSSIFLGAFAIVGMLSLTGVPGVGLRLWIGGFTATVGSLYFYFNDHKYPRAP